MTRVGLCTDSSSQLAAADAASLGVEVVPIVVVVDEEELAEGEEIDADDFYARLASEPPPRVTTSQPSPARFATAYEALAGRGAEEILSVHVDGNLSGTLNAARIAAAEAPVPVTLVDSKATSFGVGACVLAAARALAEGVGVDGAAEVVARVSASLGNVFVLGQAAEGGRLRGAGAGARGVPVLTFGPSGPTVVATVLDGDSVVDAMARHIGAQPSPLSVAVGASDPSTFACADTLARELELEPAVREVLRYRVGPSVGVHTGPGTFGAFWWAAGLV